MPHLIRTTHEARAHLVAKRLASLTGRSFRIVPIRRRTQFEVHPAAATLPRKTVRAFIRLAESLVDAEKAAAAEEN